MKKVAFLANSFHLSQTGSSQFFTDLLKIWYDEVAIVAHQDVWTKVPLRNWDLIVVWQHRFSRVELFALGCPNIVFVPMYDDCPKDQDSWKSYLGFKILCFSSTLHEQLTAWGHLCLKVRYQTPIPERRALHDGKVRGFFWPRTLGWSWSDLRQGLEGTLWDSFHLHTGHTPSGCELPTERDFPAGSFRHSEWFEKKEDFQAVLEGINVFLAPRRYEGIGMALLEALAMGACVVAADEPTACEYIEHGQDGLLLGPSTALKIDAATAQRIGVAARTKATEFRQRWNDDLPRIQEFLEWRVPVSGRRDLGLLMVRLARGYLRNAYRALRRRRLPFPQPEPRSQSAKENIFRVAFVDHPIGHKGTGSSLFFIELLKSWFGHVEVLAPHQFDEVGSDGTWDLVILWQHVVAPHDLSALRCRNIVLVPMYDDCPKSESAWKPYRGIKILSFSSTLGNQLRSWGHRVLVVKYRPEMPTETSDYTNGPRGFFWPRNPQLDWRHLGGTIRGVPWTKFSLHVARQEPGTLVPAEDDLPLHSVVTSWFKNPNDLQATLRDCNVYFAPRRTEGIGMAFLEALALGMFVIAPHFPTHSEYIESGLDGLLYDPDDPKIALPSNYETIGNRAREKAAREHQAWHDSLPSIEQFLRSFDNLPRRVLHPITVVKLWRRSLKKLLRHP